MTCAWGIAPRCQPWCTGPLDCSAQRRHASCRGHFCSTTLSTGTTKQLPTLDFRCRRSTPRSRTCRAVKTSGTIRLQRRSLQRRNGRRQAASRSATGRRPLPAVIGIHGQMAPQQLQRRRQALRAGSHHSSRACSPPPQPWTVRAVVTTWRRTQRARHNAAASAWRHGSRWSCRRRWKSRPHRLGTGHCSPGCQAWPRRPPRCCGKAFAFVALPSCRLLAISEIPEDGYVSGRTIESRTNL